MDDGRSVLAVGAAVVLPAIHTQAVERLLRPALHSEPRMTPRIVAPRTAICLGLARSQGIVDLVSRVGMLVVAVGLARVTASPNRPNAQAF